MSLLLLKAGSDAVNLPWSASDITSTHNWNTAGIVWGGLWYNSGALRYVWSGARPARVDFAVTGTRLDVVLRNAVADNWEVKIDEGSWTTLTVSGINTDVNVTIFSGVHKKRNVSLRSRANNGAQVKITGFCTIWGHTTPIIGVADTFGDSPTVFEDVNVIDHTSYLSPDSSLVKVSYGGIGNVYSINGNCTGGSIRFRATCSLIRIWAQAFAGELLRIAVDDVWIDPVVTYDPAIGDGTFGWHTVATGLDNSQEHEYRIVSVSGNNHFAVFQVGTDGTVNTGAIPVKTKVAFYGDSITKGTGVADNSRGFAGQLMMQRGWVGRLAGLDGRSIKNYASLAAGGIWSGESGVVSNLKAYGSDYEKIIVALGANDGLLIYAAYNAANVRTACDNMLTSLRTEFPSARIYVFGVLNSDHANLLTNRTSVNTQLSDAVIAKADANITYHSTDGWITPATDTSDNVHPNTAGVAKIVAAMSAIIT